MFYAYSTQPERYYNTSQLPGRRSTRLSRSNNKKVVLRKLNKSTPSQKFRRASRPLQISIAAKGCDLDEEKPRVWEDMKEGRPPKPKFCLRSKSRAEELQLQHPANQRQFDSSPGQTIAVATENPPRTLMPNAT